MVTWARVELQATRLGDRRREERLVQLAGQLAAQPTASIPQACQSHAATKAAYRFFASEAVEPEAIRAGARQACVARLAEHETVLVLQDTTSLDFTDHPATADLGPLEHVHRRGLFVHTALACTVTGVPLGVLGQKSWARDPDQVGGRHRRRQRSATEKESAKWGESLRQSLAAVPAGITTVTIADREADVFALFATPRPPTAHLLIRATQNRRVAETERYLRQTVEQSPVQGQVVLDVPAKPGQAARVATCTVRFGSVTVQPPRHRPPDGRAWEPVQLQVVLVQETNVPPGVQRLEWLLLTTLAVDDLAAALRCIEWYRFRWLVERYHLVLKSGCRVEELQLETADRLERALAVYSIVAWRLLWLTYQARQCPEQSCAVALKPHEWQALYCTIHQTTTPPTQPPTLGQAVRWIAQLGGFLGRKHDGDPGVIVIWRGLRRLHDISATYQLFHPSPLVGNG